MLQILQFCNLTQGRIFKSESNVTGIAEEMEKTWKYVKAIDGINVQKRKSPCYVFAGLPSSKVFPSQILYFPRNKC